MGQISCTLSVLREAKDTYSFVVCLFLFTYLFILVEKLKDTKEVGGNPYGLKNRSGLGASCERF